MKSLTASVLILSVVYACTDENVSSDKSEDLSVELARKIENACGATQLVWLQEIITKANEDQRSQVHQGNYMGTIYLETYENEPVFLVRMAMGSGGLAGYVYRCDGSRVDFNDGPLEVESFFKSVKEDEIIYTNVP